MQKHVLLKTGFIVQEAEIKSVWMWAPCNLVSWVIKWTQNKNQYCMYIQCIIEEHGMFFSF